MSTSLKKRAEAEEKRISLYLSLGLTPSKIIGNVYDKPVEDYYPSYQTTDDVYPLQDDFVNG